MCISLPLPLPVEFLLPPRYDCATLVEREKEAEQVRLDAVEAAGLEAPGIDESDSES